MDQINDLHPYYSTLQFGLFTHPYKECMNSLLIAGSLCRFKTTPTNKNLDLVGMNLQESSSVSVSEQPRKKLVGGAVLRFAGAIVCLIVGVISCEYNLHN